jgi:glycosyltransferase involved in cell wall biosynthesis
MKVLIINISDTHGGAARAAYNLHSSLLAEKVDSQMLVRDKHSGDYRVHGFNYGFNKFFNMIRSTLDSLPLKFYKNKSRTMFSSAWLPLSGVARRINALDADIVHLHWICGAMMSIEELASIKAPIVWSLHDMWPFTGGCHYDEYCYGFKKNCGNCKVLQSDVEIDLSRKTFKRKQKTYSRLHNITVVGLSTWMASEARASTLFKAKNVVNLPNPINTNTFAPFDQVKARELLNLPIGKKLILFGAVGATSDPRKGFKELSAALAHKDLHDKELVIFGSSEPREKNGFVQKTHYLGSLHDKASLRALYCAADVTVVPSLQENLSNVIMESLACGTPVVGFKIGGNADMVVHRENGYLAKPFSSEDLATGIDWTIKNNKTGRLGKNAREKVLNCFNSKVVAKQYIELYKEILHSR